MMDLMAEANGPHALSCVVQYWDLLNELHWYELMWDQNIHN